MLENYSSSCKEYFKVHEDIPEGFAHCKIILDEGGTPTDLIVLDLNTSCESLIRVKKGHVQGKKFTEALHHLQDDDFDYIGNYGRVALTGKSSKFEFYSTVLKRWYSVFAFSDQYLHFSIIVNDITETKNLLNDLQKANHLNEILLDAIPHPALLIRKDRTVIAANKMAKEAGTIIGGFCWRDWSGCKYLCPQDKKDVANNKEVSDRTLSCSFCKGDIALQKKECVNIKEKLGDIFWDIYWVPTQEEDVYLHYSIDITEQKKIENDLRESESRFRQLTEATFEGICIHSNGTILDCNKRMETMFGYSFNELVGIPLSYLVTAGLEGKHGAKNEDGTCAPDEYFGIKKDGTRFDIEILTDEIVYKGNKVEVFVVRDISKSKSIEESIKKVKNTLNDAQSMAHIGNIELDFNDDKMYWSDETFRIFGYEPQEFQPNVNLLVKHILPDDWDLVSKKAMKITPLGSPVRHEGRFIKLDGTEGRYNLVGDVDFDRQNFKAASFFLIIQDITEKKQAELIKIQNEENLRLLREAQEMDRLKTEFFANISHEFRTPLNIIFSSLQLLDSYIRKGLVTDSQHRIGKRLRGMKQNCYRLLRLTNNLIDLTKIDTGFTSLQPENTDIIKIIADICSSVSDYMKDKDINFEYKSQIGQKVVKCDPDKIERIILNLLSNAMKFTKPGGNVTLDVSLEEGNIFVCVEDNGVGIPKDKQEKIFDRFIQVDRLLTRSHEGCGIGLSLVKSLVDMHGGQIWVESESGKGSKFVLTLPDRILESKAVTQPYSYNQQKDRNYFVELMNIEFSDIYS